METAADRQVHHGLDGGVEQLQHQHNSHRQHQHRQLDGWQLQPKPHP